MTYPFLFVAFFAIVGALLRDAFRGGAQEKENAVAILLIGVVISLVATPIMLWAGWSPP